MIYKSFRFIIIARMAMLMLTIFLIVYLALQGEFWASVVGLLLLLTLQLWLFLRCIEQVPREVNDFFQALVYDDVNRQFLYSGSATNLALAEAFTRVQTRFQQLRQGNEEFVRYYSLLLEKVPTALVVLSANGSLEMVNHAAQRLFQRCTPVAADNVLAYGENFYKDLQEVVPGERRTTTLTVQQATLSVVLTAAVLRISAGERKVFTVQPIQQELDEREIQAWQNLVQVFTHEIMNSMTPVASLSRTASNLLAELDVESEHHVTHEKIVDAGFAINTLARRADHLMKFVQAYQRVANPPALNKSSVVIESLFAEVCKLFDDQARSKQVKMRWQAIPGNLVFTLDRVQIEQALINLVKNSLEAIERSDGEIFLSAYLARDGNLTLDVSDNGAGIPAQKLEQIFVPFYTSKAEGSGIGLFLVKQVMQAHHGSVRAFSSERGGALVRLSFF